MLLLTGATGLVGSELLPLLEAARPDRPVLRLARPQNDLTLPDLGLDGAARRRLEAEVTMIVHCAAETRFGLGLEQVRAVNVGGTRNLLGLARRCRRLEKFVHLSTVYVAGRRTGVIPEAPAEGGHGFFNTYQQSKLEAEEAVLEARSEVPAAIFRFSSIIGDSRTGRVRQFNYVHQLLKLFPRNVLPVAPGDPRSPVDLVPTDWAAAAVARLIEHAFVPGRIYQVCAGPARSLTLAEMLDYTVELFGGSVRAPELVSLEEYEKYVERSRRQGDRLLNELLRVLGQFLPHLGLYQAFENRHTREELEGSGIELPPAREFYRKVVAYCLATEWGRRGSAPAAPPTGTA